MCLQLGIVKQFNLSEGDKLNWEIKLKIEVNNRCETIKSSKKIIYNEFQTGFKYMIFMVFHPTFVW